MDFLEFDVSVSPDRQEDVESLVGSWLRWCEKRGLLPFEPLAALLLAGGGVRVFVRDSNDDVVVSVFRYNLDDLAGLSGAEVNYWVLKALCVQLIDAGLLKDGCWPEVYERSLSFDGIERL